MPETPVSAKDAGVVVSGLGFPRTARVRAKAEFGAVFEAGRRTAEPRMALHWLADAGTARLGLAVSRKVDPDAVGRNRIKRALREAFRHVRGRLPGGAYVVVARSGAAQADGAALRDAFERLLTRAGALPPPPPAGTMPPANPLPPDDAAPVRGPSQPA
ncbi:MAG TPA: ribonuclease P protein component [Thermomonas sp.]|nr:ribonuclease P protein component [Thermomonas sp.]